MALTLQEIAEIQPLDQAKLLASDPSLSREVRGIACPTTPDALASLKGGELVFAQWPREQSLQGVKEAY